MLPVRGTFELVHAVRKSVLWSAVIEPQATASVHTVSLQDPILLLINLEFCRSSQGALVHKPPSSPGEDRGLAETVLDGFKGLLDDNHMESISDSIMLTDSVGQRLRLELENKQGGGGNRSITIYCPYWVVNSSQYSLRLREEGAKYLPAGTVTAKRFVFLFCCLHHTNFRKYNNRRLLHYTTYIPNPSCLFFCQGW